jgi:acetyl-CoA synthetase
MAAVVGVPDRMRGEIVKAFIVAKPGVATGPDLAEDISRFVGERLAHYQRPREIAFVEALPLTATGKILRRELRAQQGG